MWLREPHVCTAAKAGADRERRNSQGAKPALRCSQGGQSGPNGGIDRDQRAGPCGAGFLREDTCVEGYLLGSGVNGGPKLGLQM